MKGRPNQSRYVGMLRSWRDDETGTAMQRRSE